MALAALTGAVVAVIGLTAWKKQLKGKTDYELARRYLRSVYKIRDALKYVRNPFISHTEMMLALKEEGKDSSSAINNKDSIRAVYVVRWKKVTEANSDLDVELKEAEVSWGKGAVEVQKDFQDCIKKLLISLRIFIEQRVTEPGKMEEIDNIIYDGGDGDEFNQAVQLATKKIEEYLKPHLR